ncbi:Cell wall / vacuolar inhibitor of fructosidase 1 [Linum grandiflorum]
MPNPSDLTGALTPAAMISAAIFLVILTTTTTHAASDLIEQTCKQTPDHDLCVSSITADPRSPNAIDVQALALIMVDVVNEKALATSEEINRLVQSNPTEPLTDCFDKYRTILDLDVGIAIRALHVRNPGVGEGAMNDAGNKADSCERGFEEGKSPLTDMNKDVRKVADVASAIFSQLI